MQCAEFRLEAEESVLILNVAYFQSRHPRLGKCFFEAAVIDDSLSQETTFGLAHLQVSHDRHKTHRQRLFAVVWLDNEVPTFDVLNVPI